MRKSSPPTIIRQAQPQQQTRRPLFSRSPALLDAPTTPLPRAPCPTAAACTAAQALQTPGPWRSPWAPPLLARPCPLHHPHGLTGSHQTSGRCPRGEPWHRHQHLPRGRRWQPPHGRPRRRARRRQQRPGWKPRPGPAAQWQTGCNCAADGRCGWVHRWRGKGGRSLMYRGGWLKTPHGGKGLCSEHRQHSTAQSSTAQRIGMALMHAPLDAIGREEAHERERHGLERRVAQQQEGGTRQRHGCARQRVLSPGGCATGHALLGLQSRTPAQSHVWFSHVSPQHCSQQRAEPACMQVFWQVNMDSDMHIVQPTAR